MQATEVGEAQAMRLAPRSQLCRAAGRSADLIKGDLHHRWLPRQPIGAERYALSVAPRLYCNAPYGMLDHRQWPDPSLSDL